MKFKNQTYVVGAIFIVLILFIVGISQFQNSKNKKKNGPVQAQIRDVLVSGEDLANVSGATKKFSGEYDLASGETEFETKEDVGNLNLVSEVEIALLASIDENSNLKAKQRGCDVVVMINRPVKPTTAPLTAAYKELFGYDKELTFSPGNFITTQTELKFDYVTVEDGVAHVYLKGNLEPLGGSCDVPRLRSQIEETALQYPKVKEVKIFINGSIYKDDSLK